MASSESAPSPQAAPGSSSSGPPGPPAPPRHPTMFENEDDDYNHVSRDEANDASSSALAAAFGEPRHDEADHGAGNNFGGNGGGNGGGINGGDNHDAGAGGSGHGDEHDQYPNGAANGGGNGGDGGDGPPDDAAPPPNPNQIELKVVDNGGNTTHFRVKKTTKFTKIFNAYAMKEGKDLRTLRFLHAGDRVLETSTPEELELEDSDQIDVMIEQIGGGDFRMMMWKAKPSQPSDVSDEKPSDDRIPELSLEKVYDAHRRQMLSILLRARLLDKHAVVPEIFLIVPDMMDTESQQDEKGYLKTDHQLLEVLQPEEETNREDDDFLSWIDKRPVQVALSELISTWKAMVFDEPCYKLPTARQSKL